MGKTSSRGLVIKDGKILLMYREKNGKQYFSVPGGKLEEGETPEQTVVRELLEETCLNVKPIKFLGKFEHIDKEYEHNLFLCEYVSGEVKLGDSVEMEIMHDNPTNYFRPEWVEINRVLNLNIKPESMSDFIKDYLKTAQYA